MADPTTIPTRELAPTFTLERIAGVVAFVNEANGWYQDERTWGADLALLHSEISEALEAYRSHGYADATIGEPLEHEGRLYGVPKPEGVGSELADVVIRLLDTYHRRTGRSRPQWWDKPLREVTALRAPGLGFGDWIAYLHYLVADERLETLLPYVAGVAKDAGVDLFDEVQRKIAYNVTRGHRHGGKRL